jgi:hypothetical protein
MTTKNYSKCKNIDRNSIPQLEFLSKDVLLTLDSKKSRQKQLQDATFIGNIEEKKVTLEFLSKSGFHLIHTTIWAVTNEWVVLKEKQQIPIKSIRSVEFS